ncbi:MAG: CoA ester lyase [Mycobacteriaceae bacterium]
MESPLVPLLARSYLYVPGDQPAKLARALDRGADALIVDLEDAVAPAGKDAARAAVAQWLSSLSPAAARRVWVRINAAAAGHADADAVVPHSPAGLVVAKTESLAELHALDGVLRAAEERAGVEAGCTALVPLLESAAAVLDAAGIATAPRVVRLQLGEADLRADLGITPGPDESELTFVRSHVVLVSAARGLLPPVASTSVVVRDLDGLRRSTRALARLGFVGRTCIHPAQVPVVNEVFTPGAEEVAAARSLLVRFDRSVAAGAGVLTDSAGSLVDEAVVRQARRLLTLAAADDPDGQD